GGSQFVTCQPAVLVLVPFGECFGAFLTALKIAVDELLARKNTVAILVEISQVTPVKHVAFRFAQNLTVCQTDAERNLDQRAGLLDSDGAIPVAVPVAIRKLCQIGGRLREFFCGPLVP